MEDSIKIPLGVGIVVFIVVLVIVMMPISTNNNYINDTQQNFFTVGKGTFDCQWWEYDFSGDPKPPVITGQNKFKIPKLEIGESLHITYNENEYFSNVDAEDTAGYGVQLIMNDGVVMGEGADWTTESDTEQLELVYYTKLNGTKNTYQIKGYERQYEPTSSEYQLNTRGVLEGYTVENISEVVINCTGNAAYDDQTSYINGTFVYHIWVQKGE